MRAVYNGVVLAESDQTVIVEGNHYFPPSSVNAENFTTTDLTTRCPWKGDASYYNIKVGDEIAENSAWYYPAPMEKATDIKDHVAFFPVVEVS